jgi:hypothetical protein
VSFTLLLAVTAAVAASMGYLAARKHGDEDNAPPDGSEDEDDKKDEKRERDKKREEEPKKSAAKPVKKPAGSPFATLPLALGDVVQSGSEERWLAGAIVARENGRVIGALFVAPEGAEHHAVAAFAPPRKDVWWMSPAELDSPSEPPATIEIKGVALPRKGRLPVTLERLGQGAPMVGEDGIWAAYDRGREVAIVIASQGKAYAWSGVRLDEQDYDRLGGGGEDI